jgi:hypothetical protein
MKYAAELKKSSSIVDSLMDDTDDEISGVEETNNGQKEIEKTDREGNGP